MGFSKKIKKIFPVRKTEVCIGIAFLRTYIMRTYIIGL